MMSQVTKFDPERVLRLLNNALNEIDQLKAEIYLSGIANNRLMVQMSLLQNSVNVVSDITIGNSVYNGKINNGSLIDPILDRRLKRVEMGLIRLDMQIGTVAMRIVGHEMIMKKVLDYIHQNEMDKVTFASKLNELADKISKMTPKKAQTPVTDVVRSAEGWLSKIGSAMMFIGGAAPFIPVVGPMIASVAAAVGAACSNAASVANFAVKNHITDVMDRAGNFVKDSMNLSAEVFPYITLNKKDDFMKDLSFLEQNILLSTFGRAKMVSRCDQLGVDLVSLLDNPSWSYYYVPLFGSKLNQDFLSANKPMLSSLDENCLPVTDTFPAHAFVIMRWPFSPVERWTICFSTGDWKTIKDHWNSLLEGKLLTSLNSFIEVDEVKIDPETGQPFTAFPSSGTINEQKQWIEKVSAAEWEDKVFPSMNLPYTPTRVAGGDIKRTYYDLEAFCILKMKYDKRPYHVFTNNCQANAKEIIHYIQYGIYPAWWNASCSAEVLKSQILGMQNWGDSQWFDETFLSSGVVTLEPPSFDDNLKQYIDANAYGGSESVDVQMKQYYLNLYDEYKNSVAMVNVCENMINVRQDGALEKFDYYGFSKELISIPMSLNSNDDNIAAEANSRYNKSLSLVMR